MTPHLLMLCCLTAPAVAGTRLFDFETPDELAVWHPERAPGRPVSGLALSNRLATSGNRSLEFSSPQWKEGLARWPAFEGTPPVTDWSGYDRLFFEVTNPTAFVQRLNLFITDSTIATRSGLSSMTVLQPYSYTAVVVPLAGFASRKIDPKDIRTLHFYTADVPGDMTLYLDRLTLLAQDEPAPAVPERYLREFAGLLQPRVDQLRAALNEALERLSRQAAGQPETQAWIAEEVKPSPSGSTNSASWRRMAIRGSSRPSGRSTGSIACWDGWTPSSRSGSGSSRSGRACAAAGSATGPRSGWPTRWSRCCRATCRSRSRRPSGSTLPWHATSAKVRNWWSCRWSAACGRWRSGSPT